MKAVAIEEGLTPVKQYLVEQGCRVIDMEDGLSTSNQAAVMVVTGVDKNLMGMQSIKQNIPVISADGLTPEDVYNRVKSHLHDV